MDLDSIEGLSGIRPSVYRASMKLLSLQRHCHMDVVSLRHIKAALQLVGGATSQQEVVLNRQEVSQTLERMFHNASLEVAGHVTAESPEETCVLLFRLYDREQSGWLSADSLQTALIGLSTESLLVKYRALVGLAENGSGSVSRSGLKSLLQDLNQIPAAVQEESVFGCVEAAVKSCFNGVLTSMAVKHVLSWFQCEPHLLLWLPTLYRLTISQKVTHRVRCHTCKTFPITGLRYRCMKCLNVQVCQSCFLFDRETVKHKSCHPVMEFCTQPTWRESLSSIVRSTRHALLPRRYSQREGATRRVLMRVEQGETHLSSPPVPTDPSTPLAVSAVNQSPSSDRDVSHDALVESPACSKLLQIDGEPQQALSLLAEVRNLQRDKGLFEQQLQAWRLMVQSEQGILGNRCSEMEVTMETLRKNNLNLQMMLTQALNKMEAELPPSVQSGTRSSITSDLERNDEEEGEEDVPAVRKERLPPFPTMHQVTASSQDIHCEDGEGSAEGIGPQDEETCLSEEDEEYCGKSSPAELLQEAVDRLKADMETDRLRHRRTDDRRGAELQEAAGQVEDAIHHLVGTVRETSAAPLADSQS